MKIINLILCTMLLFLLISPGAIKAKEQDVTVKGKVVKAVIEEGTGRVFVLLPDKMFKPLNSSLQLDKHVSVGGSLVSEQGHDSVKVETVKIN